MEKLSARNLVSAVLVFVALAGLTICPSRAEDSADKAKLIQDEFAGWSNNMDQLLTVFTEDVIYEDVTMGVVNHNKEEVRGFASGFFPAFPDIRFAVDSALIISNHAAVEWTVTGTQTGDMPGMLASNRRATLRGVSIIEFGGGKIARQTDYWDLATLLRQLGFLPPPK